MKKTMKNYDNAFSYLTGAIFGTAAFFGIIFVGITIMFCLSAPSFSVLVDNADKLGALLLFTLMCLGIAAMMLITAVKNCPEDKRSYPKVAVLMWVAGIIGYAKITWICAKYVWLGLLLSLGGWSITYRTRRRR